ncbi:MAG: hypothetical protein R3E68_13535 [Burkholderiaceae bacterium]
MQAGEAARIDVWCYSYRPTDAAWHTLTRMLRRICGPQALTERVAMLALGDEDDLPAARPGQPTLVIVLFSLTATPEAEHHLRVLQQLQASQPGAGPMVALVDEQPFRERFADQPDRLEQRRQNWQRVLADGGIATVFAPLSEAGEPALEGALKNLPGQPGARPRSPAAANRPAPPDDLAVQRT